MESNEIIIKQVTTFSPELADGIRALVQQLGKNASPLTDEDLRELIQSPASFLFIAQDSVTKQIAGMIFLAVYRIPYTQKAYLDDLIVDEAFRKQGIAKRLFQHAIDKAKEHNASYIDFTSRPRRSAGNLLYEKLGFQKRETNVYRLPIMYDEV